MSNHWGRSKYDDFAPSEPEAVYDVHAEHRKAKQKRTEEAARKEQQRQDEFDFGFDDEPESPVPKADTHPGNDRPSSSSSNKSSSSNSGGNSGGKISVVPEARYRQLQQVLKKREQELISVVRDRKKLRTELLRQDDERKDLTKQLARSTDLSKRATRMATMALKGKVGKLEAELSERDDHISQQERQILSLQRQVNGDEGVREYRRQRAEDGQIDSVKSDLADALRKVDEWKSMAEESHGKLVKYMKEHKDTTTTPAEPKRVSFAANLEAPATADKRVLDVDVRSKGAQTKDMALDVSKGNDNTEMTELVQELKEEIRLRAIEKDKMLSKLQDLVGMITKLKTKNKDTKKLMKAAIAERDAYKLTIDSEGIEAAPQGGNGQNNNTATVELLEVKAKLDKVTRQAHEKLAQQANVITALRQQLDDSKQSS